MTTAKINVILAIIITTNVNFKQVTSNVKIKKASLTAGFCFDLGENLFIC